MSGIYLANANEKKNKFQIKEDEEEKNWKLKLKVLTISMNVRRCEAFMNSNMLRKRLQIEANTQQKCIHFFPQFIHIFFSSQKSHWIQAIMSFSIQPIMLKSLWRHERCFRCTLMTFFHILFRRCQQKIEIFQSLGIFFGHWLKHEPFERKLCDDNHNGINHKILKWQLNRIKSKNSQSTNFSWNCERKRIDLWPKYACGATILVGI